MYFTTMMHHVSQLYRDFHKQIVPLILINCYQYHMYILEAKAYIDTVLCLIPKHLLLNGYFQINEAKCVSY